MTWYDVLRADGQPKQVQDLKEYAFVHTMPEATLPKSFVVLTDCPSVVSDLLTPPVIKVPRRHDGVTSDRL